MKLETEIPEGISVDFIDSVLAVKGPKGELKRQFLTPIVDIKKDGNKIIIKSKNERREAKAMTGTVNAHLRNMIKGVQEEYTYKLRSVFSHFPVTLKVEGSQFKIDNYLGEKYARTAQIPEGVKVEVKGSDIEITGIDKELVGMTATRLEQASRLSYRDRRVFQDGIYLIEKDGKPV